MMKKLLSILISALLILSSLSLFACGNTGTPDVTYTVTITEPVNGTLSVDNEKPVLGSAVNITAKPDAGYILYALKINGGKVSPAQGKDGYSYVIPSALDDYTIEARFEKPDVTISFVGVENAIANQKGKYGSTYGSLPTPFEVGKRFAGWRDSNGTLVTSEHIIRTVGSIKLTAEFVNIDETYATALVPNAITTAIYDAAATMYGVTWHTNDVPSKPVIVLADNADFTDAKEIDCTYRAWHDLENGIRYSVYGVISGLEFAKEYFVKFGDKAVEETYWSKTYNFTTREEEVKDLSFFFVNGTNQQYLPEHMKTAGDDCVTTDTYWSYVMKEATERFSDADFIAHGGEFVSYNLQFARWDAMVGSVEDYLFDLPVMGTTGQIEVSNQRPNDNPVREGLGMMYNIDSKSTDNSSGMFYSFNYGPMHFINIRTADLYLSNRTGKTNYQTEIDDDQLIWIKEDLDIASKDPNIKWIVVMMAENPMDIDQELRDGVSAASKKANFQKIMQEQLLTVFKTYGVDLVLSGSPRSRALVSSKPLTIDFGTSYFLADVLTTTENYDGVEVTKFAPNGDADTGTVYHQTGVAGSNYTAGVKEWDGSSNSSNPKAVKNAGVYKLTDDIGMHDVEGVYRKLLSGDKGCIDANKAYSMYSYVEINENQIVVRTYGVDVIGASTATENYTNFGRYLDGFMISK